MSEAVIRVERLGKRYRTWAQPRPTNVSERLKLAWRGNGRDATPIRQEIWALRDVSFDVERGEVLGVIGANGAGKSTLLTVLARITEPTEGYAEIEGRVSSLLEVGTGFHPELSGRDNVFLNGAVLGMSRAETARKYDEIVEFAGLHDFMEMPVKRYSTGMYMRLAFAVAAHLDPEILLLDEVLSVGDRAFQEKSLERIEQMTRTGRTVLFVSHDASSVAKLCRRAILMQDGSIAFAGDVEEAMERYLGARRHLVGGGHVEGFERIGSGEVRFCNVTVTNADGGSAIFADQPMTITVEFAAQQPLPGDQLQVHLTISSAIAGELVSLSTAFHPEQPLRSIDVGHGTTLVCSLDELPLRPGHYYVSLALERIGGTVDRVQTPIEFTVLPSDFFGSGAPPPDSQAPLLVRHRWLLAERPAVRATAELS